MIMGIDHVQLAMPSGEEESARRFYSDVLGLQSVPKPGPLAERGGCWFRSLDAELHLGVEEDFQPARKAHPALIVDDLSAMKSRLLALGFDVVEALPIGGRNRFHTSDPFGNRLELIEARR